MSSIVRDFFNIVRSEMVTGLNNTGKRKMPSSKHKITTRETDYNELQEKESNNPRQYSVSDSPCLPPNYTRKFSTLHSPKKKHQRNKKL